MKKLTGDSATGVAAGMALGKSFSEHVKTEKEEQRQLAEDYVKEEGHLPGTFKIEENNLFKGNLDTPEGREKYKESLSKMSPAQRKYFEAQDRAMMEQAGKDLQKQGWEAKKVEVKNNQKPTVSYQNFIANKGGSK